MPFPSAAVIARLTAVVLGLLTALAPTAAQAADGPVVRFSTSLGAIDVRLLPGVAPKTVANFLGYVERRDYDGSFFHRSVKDFVIQGGGYTGDADTPKPIPAKPAVANEFGESNRRGTLAMAKVDGNPDSATNQWFFNTAENAGKLDDNNGGFTVFGRVTDAAGLAVMDAVAALPTRDPGTFAALKELPVRDWTSGPVRPANLVSLASVAVLPAQPPPAAPAPTPGATPAPAPRPTTPAATPRPPAWRLLSRQIAAPTLSRRATRVRVTVHGLPAGTKLRATLTGAGPPLTTRVSAPRGGPVRVSFALPRSARRALRRSPRGALLVAVVATPPGGRATRATALVALVR